MYIIYHIYRIIYVIYCSYVACAEVYGRGESTFQLPRWRGYSEFDIHVLFG